MIGQQQRDVGKNFLRSGVIRLTETPSALFQAMTLGAGQCEYLEAGANVNGLGSSNNKEPAISDGGVSLKLVRLHASTGVDVSDFSASERR